MKKRSVLCAILLVCTSTITLAAEQRANYRDEFSKPIFGIDTVKSVLDASAIIDDRPVLLTGYIVKSLGDEIYVFKDNTGSINVRIDGDKMPDSHINPEKEVTIKGEINKEANYRIFVNSVTSDE